MSETLDLFDPTGVKVGQPLTTAQIVANGQGVTSTCFDPNKGGVIPPRVAVNPQQGTTGEFFKVDPVPGNLGSFGVHD